MRETMHTPGPWTAVDGPATLMGDCYLSHQVWGKQRIAFIETQNTGIKVADANARLIAAAPDLLAALQPFAALVHEDGVDTPYPGERWIPLLMAAAAAIAKAEGREVG